MEALRTEKMDLTLTYSDSMSYLRTHCPVRVLQSPPSLLTLNACPRAPCYSWTVMRAAIVADIDMYLHFPLAEYPAVWFEPTNRRRCHIRIALVVSYAVTGYPMAPSFSDVLIGAVQRRRAVPGF